METPCSEATRSDLPWLASFALALATALLACSGGPDLPAISSSGGAKQTVQSSDESCTPGDVESCKYNFHYNGSVPNCSAGVRTCGDAGAWEPCGPPPARAPRDAGSEVAIAEPEPQ